LKTPIFGPYALSRAPNVVDARCVNLMPRAVQTKEGKAIGALYLTPGLTKLATVGAGPIWGLHVFNGYLYVISGSSVYVLDQNYAATKVGEVSSPVTQVPAMEDNGNQMGIFTDKGGWLLGKTAGQPLTGGTISNPGYNYALADSIVLSGMSGSAPIVGATIMVSAVDGSGGVTGFTVTNGGSFADPKPLSFNQGTTTGSGQNFSLDSPTFGASANLVPIQLPFAVTGQIGAAQQDGFLLLSQPGTNTIYQSALLDMSTWPPLAFAAADGNPDPILAMQEIHREIFVIETYETEVWVNAGTSPFAFARLDGVYIEAWTQAPATVVQVGEDLMWLAQNRDGTAIVIRVRGYNPINVTDHSVAAIWQSYDKTSDAVAYCYQQDNQSFYVISFPSANATWVYDVTESELLGIPCWHQRAALDPQTGAFIRHPAQVALSSVQGALFNNQMVLGAWADANIYAYDFASLTDDGVPRKWLRSWRALAQPVMQPQRFSQLQVDMQTGAWVGDPHQVDDPKVSLTWSDDGGHSWAQGRIGAAGATGETAKRVIFRRLGSTRRNSGLDRIFELSSADPFPVAIVGAEFE
jgi:hypothetical protein